MRRHPGTFRLAEITDLLGGSVEGDPAIVVSNIATLASAVPGDLSFLTRSRYRNQLPATQASALIVSAEDRAKSTLPLIVCDDPYLYLARALSLFYPPDTPSEGIHPSATIESGARVASTASIGPGCHIARDAVVAERVRLDASCVIGENARIGEDSRLHAGVIVYPECSIGKRAIIHSGAVIGADGFGMARDGDRWVKIPQVGRVIIGDDVEIGACTTVDRGALDDTVIEDGVKLDNQIQIGHNVRIGADTAMAGCVGIAGSAKIGRRCTLGGGAIVLGHLDIADDVHISAGTLVMKSIREPGSYAGVYPLQKRDAWARNAAQLRHLDELAERVRHLEAELQRIKKE